jgi:PilZ domain-containing protein
MRWNRWLVLRGKRRKTVAVSSEVDHALRMLDYMRSARRVNSRVKVAVEWDEKGETRRAEGYTVDISPKGCLAVVPQGFAVGQKMKLLNSVNGRVSEATLIWRGHEGRTGWELGLELVNAPAEFWGVDF